MFHRLASISPLPGYKLRAEFNTGEERLYDVGALEKIWPVFGDLRAISGLFELAHLEAGGCGVVWNEYLDLSSEEIWHEGVPI
jgi:hypothetical protein